MSNEVMTLTYTFTNTKTKITKVRTRNWLTVKLPVILGPHGGNSLRALSVDVEISWTRTTETIIPHARWYVLQTHGRQGASAGFNHRYSNIGPPFLSDHYGC